MPGKKTKGPSFGGLRAIELNENVLMNLWVDGKSGFPGGGDADAKEPKKALDDPPYAALAVVGGASDGGTLAKRLAEKSLVRIRTMGPFRYDYETNLARFDIAPQTGNVTSRVKP